MASPDHAPAATLVAQLRDQLRRHAPFAQMEPAHVERFVAASREAYYAPGEQLIGPDDGPPEALYCVRQGAVVGRRGMAEMAAGGFQYEVGDLFPVGALLGRRAVTATYTAVDDVFCLLLPQAEVKALAADSAPFADFLNRRTLKFLDLSRRALQVAYSAQTLAEQSLETPLGDLAHRQPVALRPDAPVSQALQAMHGLHIGSVLVTDATERPVGIFTRHDALGRVALPGLSLDTPIREVMSAPAHSLRDTDTAQDAALLMSRHGVRHVPVTRDGRLVSVVSERDLFAMQRLSLKQISGAIRHAPDVATLRVVAQDVRRFARNLLGQGVRARQLTELVSHLNDVLTEHLVGLLAAEDGIDLGRACWLALGSEGRSEQTIATDQDNALVFESDAPERERPRWLAFARRVNEALDACGYPLCRGNVMASNPDCCLTPAEWSERFRRWMAHGAPEDLLNASIYFDFRPLVGRHELALALREQVTPEARALPRFLKQLADNALTHRAPLTWLGALDTRERAGRPTLDLKLQGTAIFVDAARVYALAHGVPATGTRARLQGCANALGVEAHEVEGWCGAFEFLQLLRLQAQLGDASRVSEGEPNLIDVEALNDIDRRVLKEAVRLARRLQQRLELDYRR